MRVMVCAVGLLALAAPGGCGDSPTKPVVVGRDSLTLSRTFSTFLGGSNDELLRAATIDAQGNLYVAGGTSSTDFPTTPGAYHPAMTRGGSFDYDAFVTKLNPAGQVVWSTYLGGPNYDRIYGIEVDELGFVYVAGRAGAGFPVTAGAFQTTFAGATHPETPYGTQDGFVCKLQPDGSQVVFCSYLGNDDYVPLRDIAIDANHDIYVYTSALSAQGFPAAWFANAYQKTVRGERDAMIVKIHGDGSRVEWATFLGGSGTEANTGSLRVDATGVYLACETSSPDMPTPNGFSHTLGGTNDVYVAKLSLDGSQLLYGTYVGGSGGEGAETHHLAIDGHGNAFVAVPSRSTDFPTTPTAYQRQFGGVQDVLIAKIAPDGSLAAATYLGGSQGEFPEGVAVDGDGNVFVVGRTSSPDFPATEQEGSLGGTDLVAFALSGDLSHLVFSVRAGGSGEDFGRTAAARGRTYLVGGWTASGNWPVLSALQGHLRGPGDGVVVGLSRTP